MNMETKVSKIFRNPSLFLLLVLLTLIMPSYFCSDLVYAGPSYDWHTFYGGKVYTSIDCPSGIKVDLKGNIYVFGVTLYSWNGPAGEPPLNTLSVGGINYIYVLKLDNNGVYQWHTFYGSGQPIDNIRGIYIDKTDDVYITGNSAQWNGPEGISPINSHSSGNNNDIFLLKLNGNGVYQWHTFYGTSESSEFGSAVFADNNGFVYVTGGSNSSWKGPTGEEPKNTSAGGSDIFILKLNKSGIYQWHSFFGSPNDDYGGLLTIDRNNDLTILGVSRQVWNGPQGQLPLNSSVSTTDIITVLKLEIDSSYKWHTFCEIGGGVATLDENGNIYLTGTSWESWTGPAGQPPLHEHTPVGMTPNRDVFVMKLNDWGLYQWHTFWGSETADYGTGITIDSQGNIYVIGTSGGSWLGKTPLHSLSGYSDIVILKLSNQGYYQWHTYYGSYWFDEGTTITLDNSSNIYIGGGSYSFADPQPPLNDSGYILILKLNSEKFLFLPIIIK
jgi:hypothetical protein